VLAALVGVAVEIEEGGFGRAAPDRLQALPVHVGIGDQIGAEFFQDGGAVGFGAAGQRVRSQLQLGHAVSSPDAAASTRRSVALSATPAITISSSPPISR
jgi:hypothetical protein